MNNKCNWLLTNGIGGYSSQESMKNTNKYHGLLIAAMNNPAQRQLILSNIDEKIEIDKKDYELNNSIKSYNIDNEYVEFYYDLENIQIKKSICMIMNENTVCIKYNIKNYKENITLKLVPYVNFRSFHKNDIINLEFNQITDKNKIKLEINGNKSRPIYIYCTDAVYQEKKEDFICDEKINNDEIYQNISPGIYTLKINALKEKEICFICSEKDYIDTLDYNNVFNDIVNQTNKFLNKCNIKFDDEIKKKYFSIKEKLTIKNSYEKKVLIAGYPFYLENGRILFFSIEGLALISGDYELAKNSIKSLIKSMRNGLVPNSFSGFDKRSIFDSIENSLMIISLIYKTYKYSNDTEFIKEMYPYMEEIINNHISGIIYDDIEIYMNKDYLLYSKNVTKCNNFEKNINNFFQRDNDIKFYLNGLWYNALMIMSIFDNLLYGKDEKNKYLEIATIVKESFDKFFYKNKFYYNNLIIDQLIVYSLDYPIFDKNKSNMQIYQEIKNNILSKILSEYPFIIGLYYDFINNLIKSTKNKKEKIYFSNELTKIENTVLNNLKNEINGIECGTFLFAANLGETFKIIYQIGRRKI